MAAGQQPPVSKCNNNGSDDGIQSPFLAITSWVHEKQDMAMHNILGHPIVSSDHNM